MEEKSPEPKPKKPAPKTTELAKPQKKKPGMMFIPTMIGMAGFVAFMVSAPFWATDVEDAKRTLIVNGYKPITVGGFDPFGCGIDIYSTKFTAIGPKGFKVKGNVCKTPHINPSTIDEDTSGD